MNYYCACKPTSVIADITVTAPATTDFLTNLPSDWFGGSFPSPLFGCGITAS